MCRRRCFFAALTMLCASSAGVFGQTSQTTAPDHPSPQDLKRLSLEELLKMEITTVSRVPEQPANVPAAVFVITREDIRRSGATSIPEALRLAPGVQVARINGGTWAIGIRGFADRLARSILVLIDGRAVYSPLFAGTYWESQDTLLEDVDRIEVIRGPGGTLWGANAVNGIINIITRPAKDTQGTYLSAGGGSEDRAFGSFRFGGKSTSWAYRGYVKALDRGPEFHADGSDYDGWRSAQAGFRGDATLGSGRTLTVQGDAYTGRLGARPTLVQYMPPFSSTTAVRAPVSGGNVMARLSSAASSRDSYQLQAYYDRRNRDEQPIGEDRDTVDIDWQNSIRRWTRQTISWGAGYRVTSGRITAVAPSAILPATRTDNLFSGFVQDDIVVVPQRLRLVIGSKVEHNDYTGFESQPSARLLWTPTTAQSLWTAVTRAVRTPSRVETDYTTTSLVSPAPTPTFVRLLPNPSFDSEQLIAYEAGYRLRAAERAYFTASAFYNDLRDILSTELLTPFVEAGPPARLMLPVTFANGLHGNSQGVEVTSDVRPISSVRLTANYSYVFVAASKNPGGRDVSQERHYEGAIPHHQVQAGASFDLSRWSVDYLLRYVSELPASSVPGYTASTVRVSRQLGSGLEITVVGQDLFDDHHLEWPSTGGDVEVRRSIYTRLIWRR